MIREREIKAALIDWLYVKGLVQDAVLINEMVIANWARRADIALANGRLYGFEIKSEFDSLKRLSGQVESFQRYFDKVTIVAASKFISTIVAEYPPEIGVLEVYGHKGGICLRQIRPGRIVENRNLQRLASFVTRSELERFLRGQGVKLPSDISRKTLLEYVGSVDVRSLKSFVLSSIKDRYKDTFKAFDEGRKDNGSLDSMALLSKRETQLRMQIDKAGAVSETALGLERKKYERNIDISALGLNAGAIAEGMPQTVLIRKRPQSSK